MRNLTVVDGWYAIAGKNGRGHREIYVKFLKDGKWTVSDSEGSTQVEFNDLIELGVVTGWTSEHEPQS
ncbi:MAG: hypothetical protein ACPHUL_00830 [Marinomonas gallaica]